MSQPTDNNTNYHSFGFTDPYYGPPQPPMTSNHGPFLQWHPHASASGSAANTALSPSLSSRTTTVNSPQSTLGPRPSKQQRLSPSDDRVDPALTAPFLAAPYNGQMDNTHPLQRFFHDGPWSSESMRNPGNLTSRPSYLHPYSYALAPSRPLSDTARSDSGYQTIPPTFSSISSDPGRATQDYSHDINYMQSVPFSSTSSDTTDTQRTPSNHPLDTTSLVSAGSTSRSPGRGGRIQCSDCGEISKCKSDHKKHMLKHHKHFRCDFANCRRAGKGFGTSNDLDRHKKSVHRIGALQNSWRCASDNCRNKEKIWPRLDNFKQHIDRMHSDEDKADLISRSVFDNPAPDSSGQLLEAPSLDSALIGIGEEKQYTTSNELDEPASRISLTPHQDSNLWIFRPSSTDLAMGTDDSVLMPQHPASREGQSFMLFPPSRKSHKHGRSLSIHPLASSDDAAPRVDLQLHSLTSSDGVAPTVDFQSLRTLAGMASSRTASNHISPRQPRQISDAPQTKSDQIRQIFKIIVRAMRITQGGDFPNSRVIPGSRRRSTSASLARESPPSMSADDLFVKKSSKEEDDVDEESLTETEILQVSRAISKLIKKPSRYRSRTNSTSAMYVHRCNYGDCDSSFARPCELRKHMRRHTKPYGCTFPRCHKRFGSKSDWKRHEGDQHYQKECFVCQAPPPLPAGKQTCTEASRCLAVFAKEHLFKKHIEEEHAKQADDAGAVNEAIKASKVGKNYLGTFYCGFCREVKKLEEERNQGWAERFNHIDAHFRDKKIEEWFCYDSGRLKGDRQTQVEEGDEEGESEEEEESEGQVWDRQAMQVAGASQVQSNGEVLPLRAHTLSSLSSSSSPSPLSPPRLAAAAVAIPATASTATPRSETRSETKSKARKRNTVDSDDFSLVGRSSSSGQVRKRTKTKFFNYCCECQYGPLQPGIHINCLYCDHRVCGGCDVRAENVAVEEWGPLFGAG